MSLTDTDAIALLDAKGNEADSKRATVTGTHTDFDQEKTALGLVVTEISGRVASMNKHVNYALTYFGE